MAKSKQQRRDEQEERDRQTLLETYAPKMNYCAGGRLVHEMYTCLHCGSQDPSTECGQPLDEVIKPRKMPKDFQI